MRILLVRTFFLNYFHFFFKKFLFFKNMFYICVVNMTKHKQNTMENLTVLKTLTHPKTKFLKVDIIKIESDNNISYCYDYDGDWYDFDWCENPLNECIKDAKSMLNEKYNGTYYGFDGYYSEKTIFNTCTY